MSLLAAAAACPAVSPAACGADIPMEAFTCHTSTKTAEDVAVGPDGRVWVASDGGIMVIREGRVEGKLTRQNGLVHNNVHRIALGPDGRIWVATSGGVCSLSDRGWRHYTVKDGLTDEYATTAAVDSRGRVFVGTRRGACVLAADGRHFEPLDDAHEHARRCVHDIFAAQDGSVWFAKENGLTRLLPDGRWQSFRADPMIATGRGEIMGKHVFAVLADRSGLIWIGTERGAGVFDGARWRRFSSGNSLLGMGGPLCDFVSCLAEDASGCIWMGYGDAAEGVSCVSNGVWKSLGPGAGFSGCHVRRIASDRRGGLWMAGWAGIVRVGDEGIARIEEFGELPDNHVVSIRRKANGSIMIRTATGLAFFHEGRRMSDEDAAIAEKLPDHAIEGAVRAELREHSVFLMIPGRSRMEKATLAGKDFPAWVTAVCWESGTVVWIGTASEGAIRMDLSLAK